MRDLTGNLKVTRNFRAMYCVAQVGNSYVETDRLPDGAPLEAFAHLFAAAPELYEALERLLNHQGKTMAQLPIAQQIADKEFAFATLKKARGGAI